MGQNNSLNEIADKVEARVREGHALIFIPTIFIMKKCLCSSEEIKSSFRESQQVARLRVNIVRVDLPGHPMDERPIHRVVFDTLVQRLGDTATVTEAHWFFVYHPSNTWYAKFEELVKNNPELPNKRFCGIADQIDTVVLFMREARRRITAIEAKANKTPVIMHLLIPTNNRLVIEEAIRFPADMGDFVVEAPGRGLVQLCIPQSQRSMVRGIACYMGDTTHRELGSAE